jgi:hypothetical protein
MDVGIDLPERSGNPAHHLPEPSSKISDSTMTSTFANMAFDDKIGSELDSVYDFTYDFGDQSFLVHDLLSDTYTVMGYQQVKHIVDTHYDRQRADSIARQMYSGRVVRLDPKEGKAGLNPVKLLTNEEIVGKMIAPSTIEQAMEMDAEQRANLHAEITGQLLD